MLNPKQRFKDSPNSAGWQTVVDSEHFQAAATAALAVMAMKWVDPGFASHQSMRLDGAREFLEILMHLADAEPEQQKRTAPSLNYRA